MSASFFKITLEKRILTKIYVKYAKSSIEMNIKYLTILDLNKLN